MARYWNRQATPPYVTLLDRIHRHLRPRSYVEIGVDTGASLALALPGTVAVGVDPAPNVVSPLGRQARVYEMASDDFFASVTKADALAGRPLDLAFIDGMHHFEYAFRDFINLERWADPQTTILVHDCYPPNEQMADRVRHAVGWAGDIWKLIVCLGRERPDLTVNVLDVGPSGLAVISHLDPTSTVLSDRYDALVEEFVPLPFSWLAQEGKERALRVVHSDWPTVVSLLPTPFRADNPELLRLGRALRPSHLGSWKKAALYRTRAWSRRTSLRRARTV